MKTSNNKLFYSPFFTTAQQPKGWESRGPYVSWPLIALSSKIQSTYCFRGQQDLWCCSLLVQLCQNRSNNSSCRKCLKYFWTLTENCPEWSTKVKADHQFLDLLLNIKEHLTQRLHHYKTVSKEKDSAVMIYIE